MQLARPLVGCHVLVIEDEYFTAKELSWLLEDNGAAIIGPVGYIDEALEQIARDGFEVAVVDINLQRAECFSCADELKRRGVPFVFTSTYVEENIPFRFADVHLWQEPYDQQALVEDIRRLCEGTRSGYQIISTAQAPSA